MRITMTHDSTDYVVSTVEYPQRGGVFDGQVWTDEVVLTLYAYRIRGGRHCCCSLDNYPYDPDDVAWEDEFTALKQGVATLMVELERDYQESEAA